MTEPANPRPVVEKSAAYWAQVCAVVAEAPPLTASQRDIIRRAFAPTLAAMAAEQLGRAS